MRRPMIIVPTSAPSDCEGSPRAGFLGIHGHRMTESRAPIGSNDCQTELLPDETLCSVLLSKVQSVDQRMRLGMRCRLSPTADVPSHTSGAAMCQIASSVLRTGLFGQPRFPKTLNQQLCV